MIGHPFFEDPGFTLELVNRDAVIEMRESMATFRLRFTDQRKQGQNREAIGKHKEGEAIEFNFNLESDNTVEVTSSMVSIKILHLLMRNIWYTITPNPTSAKITISFAIKAAIWHFEKRRRPKNRSKCNGNTSVRAIKGS